MRVPSLNDLKEAAKETGLPLTNEELRVYADLIRASFAMYERLDELEAPKVAVKYPRGTGVKPNGRRNLLGAWAWKCAIKGQRNGQLMGKKVVIKDNVSVAGIPLLDGSYIFKGYVPEIDATVVTRILDSGGEVVGKATCENLCFSGGSDTSYPGPVRNPFDARYMAGGSSSGCAALLAAGEVDMAIGGDQAGSIRIPSSWCGVFGLKPTWGLVPYTGAVSMESTLDHLGPMGRTAGDVALLLEAIAGRDEFDPRQKDVPTRLPSYTRELRKGARGLRIGIVREGFASAKSDPSVDESVMDASMTFKKLGAELDEISIPAHLDGKAIWTGIAREGSSNLMTHGHGLGYGWQGHYDSHLASFYSHALKRRARHLPPNAKMTILAGSFLAKEYGSKYYAKAQNLRRLLRAAYDKALEEHDLLLMPTTPTRALPFTGRSLRKYVEGTGSETYQNTCPSDVTGHPAISVPCGSEDGLPVGMQLIGRHFDEAVMLRAANAFERAE